jgi:hypothetical protein
MTRSKDMDWNDEKQARFDELRLRELRGTLSLVEKTELADFLAALETAEAAYIVPAIARMEAEQSILKERLQKMQGNNEELAKLLYQQEQLAVEARRWLTEFQQKHQQIQATYTQLTGEVLTAV